MLELPILLAADLRLSHVGCRSPWRRSPVAVALPRGPTGPRPTVASKASSRLLKCRHDAPPLGSVKRLFLNANKNELLAWLSVCILRERRRSSWFIPAQYSN